MDNTPIPIVDANEEPLPERVISFHFFDGDDGMIRFRAEFNPPIPNGCDFDTLTPSQQFAAAAFVKVRDMLNGSAVPS